MLVVVLSTLSSFLKQIKIKLKYLNPMNMNKILLVLIISSGFLLIFYNNYNNDIFTRKNIFFSAFQRKSDTNSISHNNHNIIIDTNNPIADLKRIKYIPKLPPNVEYNIFIIFTKSNYVLRNKFELFLKSLFLHCSVELHLHIITDEESELSAELVLKTQIEKYKKIVFYTLYDVEDCATKLSDIVYILLPYFSSNPGSYYSDALFYLSLGLHKIVDPLMRRAILIDCDVVFRTDVKLLFDQFER